MAHTQDLFQDAPPRAAVTADYSAKDIEVLEGLEPVRRHPAMYIGGTDAAAMHPLVAEVPDSSMYEAGAGHVSAAVTFRPLAGQRLVESRLRGVRFVRHVAERCPAGESRCFPELIVPTGDSLVSLSNVSSASSTRSMTIWRAGFIAVTKATP